MDSGTVDVPCKQAECFMYIVYTCTPSFGRRGIENCCVTSTYKYHWLHRPLFDNRFIWLCMALGSFLFLSFYFCAFFSHISNIYLLWKWQCQPKPWRYFTAQIRIAERKTSPNYKIPMLHTHLFETKRLDFLFVSFNSCSFILPLSHPYCHWVFFASIKFAQGTI